MSFAGVEDSAVFDTKQEYIEDDDNNNHLENNKIKE